MENEGLYSTNLFIECKSNATPVVFFSHKNVSPSIGWWDIKLLGRPKGIHSPKESNVYVLPFYFNFHDFHHYCKNKWSSKQYCLLKPKLIGKGSKNENYEWTTTHTELFESINGLIKASEYYSKLPIESFDSFSISLTQQYLVLLFSGPLYECKISGTKYRLEKKDHVIFHKSLISKTVNCDYNIDVITKGCLRQYLKIIDLEYRTILKKLSDNFDLVKKSAVIEYKKQ